MDSQSLAYALTQVVHNFGAVSVVGGALFGLWPRPQHSEVRQSLAWLILVGWIMQGISGAAFGAISYAWYGQFPDITDVAMAALSLKVACAIGGALLAIACLRRGQAWTGRRRSLVWSGLLLFSVTALSAAAFLRWFS